MNTKHNNGFLTTLDRLYKKDTNYGRLLIILIISVVFLGILKPSKFLTFYSFQSMAYQFPQFGLLSLGVMIAMISGGIDLSVVGIANLSAVMAAKTLLVLIQEDSTGISLGFGIIIVILVGLVVGMIAGLLNGLLISRIGIPPILATLATMQLFRGVTVVLTEGRAVSHLPIQFSNMGNATIFGIIPVPTLIFILAALGVSILLSKTVYGERLFMLGTNPVAALYSGLKIKNLLVRAYMLSGVMAALAGMVMMARMNSARADYGTQYTLQSILVVVLGGVDPNGGTGRVGTVVLAIIVLQMLSTGLNMFPSISNFYRSFIWGMVLLVILGWNALHKRKNS